MSRYSKQTCSNVYFQARLQASKDNNKLSSRESASEILHLHPATLTKYENGSLKVPHEVVMEMADVYETPMLLNDYCATKCPIGAKSVSKLEGKDIMLLTVQLHADTTRMIKAKEKMMQIMEDGVIENDELEDLSYVMSNLGQIKKTVCELELWVQKNIKKAPYVQSTKII